MHPSTHYGDAEGIGRGGVHSSQLASAELMDCYTQIFRNSRDKVFSIAQTTATLVSRS